MGVVILGSGSCQPEQTIENSQMELIVDTSDQWIQERTGIKRRSIAKEESALDMAAYAAKIALGQTPVEEIDLVIVATVTPDQLFPSMAASVKKALGLPNAVAFDISTACAGFIYGVWTADALMKANGYKKALVIGSERLSRIVDWEDRSTCVIFADGAGAVLLGVDEEKKGILGMHMQNYEDVKDALYCHAQYVAGPFFPEMPKKCHIIMNGQQVFRFAVKACPEVMNKVLEQTDVSADEIKFVVPHQANIRILSSISKNLNIPLEKFIVTIEDTGNTSAASVPMALDSLLRSGKAIPGDKIMMVGFGGGLSAGAILVEL